MAFDLDSILNKVKQTHDTEVKNETAGQSSIDARILTMKPGHSYYIRFLPEKDEDGGEIFRSYKEYGFTSRTNGKYQYAGRALQEASPDQAKNDLIKKVQWESFDKARKENDEVARKQALNLLPTRKSLVNVYLHKVEGPDDEEKAKAGKVFAFKYTANLDYKTGAAKGELNTLIEEGLVGEKSAKIGKKAFDLTENGRSLIVKVIQVTGDNGQKMPSFKQSSFDDAEDIGVSKEKEKQIRSSTHKLLELIPQVKPTEEIKKILDEHWFGTSATPEDEVDPEPQDDDDEIPMTHAGDKDELDDLLEED